MSLIVRTHTEADHEGFAQVRSRVYRGGAPIDPSENLIRPDTFGTVAVRDGVVVGAELDIDMTCTVRGKVHRSMGVASVGVLPEARRGGVGIEMLSKALILYLERGAVLASLAPFRATYYRKVGYATAGPRLSIKCPAHRLPNFGGELEVREITDQDHSAIVPCYEAFAMRYSGINIRGPLQWKSQLGGDTRFAIYAAGDPIEAFVTTRLKWDFWNDVEIRDFAWTSPRGYRAILDFFRGLCINKTSIQWWGPLDDPMLWRYDDQGLEAKADGHMQYRILSVPAVIGAIESEFEGEFVFSVDDPQLEANRGPWRVRFSPGNTEIEKGGEADFEIGIGALTQAALGSPSFDAVFAQGAVKVFHAKGVASARRFLTPHPTFCMDFF